MPGEGLPFGRYELFERIGRGGMAEIYRARLCGPGGFEKQVAIKRLLPVWSNNADFVHMLVDEAKVLTHLIHPNIVNVHELGTEGDQLYIAMEYVHGLNLKEYFKACAQKNQRLPLTIALYIAQNMLKGLEYAHSRRDRRGEPLSIVHRDISPQNILVSDEGDVKITDFGIAKAIGRSSETTQAGVLKGKFAYMSPEQARGEEVDLRSDLFAVALVLFECLTGERYFDGKNDLIILEAVKTHDPDAVFTRLSPELPPQVGRILHKALACKREDRYATAGLFLADISCLLDAYRFDPSKTDKWVDPVAYFSAIVEDCFPELSVEKDLTRTQTPTYETLLLNENREDPSPPLPEITLLPPVAPRAKHWQRAAIVMLVLVVIGAVWPGIWREDIVTAFFPSEQSLTTSSWFFSKVKQAAVIAVPVTEPAVKTTVADIPPPKGQLKVNAAPWGLVHVAGVGKSLEAPIARQLPVGNYPITVSYNGQAVQTTAVVKSNADTVCKANFIPGKEGVVCR